MNDIVIQSIRGYFSNRVGWGRISAELTLIEFSGNWSTILADDTVTPQVGVPLTTYFDEFIGLESHIQIVMRSNTPSFRLERVNRQLDNGEITYFDFTLSPIEQTTDLFFILEDVTEFGRLEQELVQERNELRLIRHQLSITNADLAQLNRFKSLFFSMAAHDLRAPLMTVRGYSDLLATIVQQKLVADQRAQALGYIHTIQTQANWLDQLIHNILDLNQIENNRFELNYALCNLNDVVTSAVDTLQPMAELNEQIVQVNLAKGGVLLDVDIKRIGQCVYNLVANAIKYTPANGKIMLTVYAKDNYGIVEIADTGYGVQAEQLPHLFDLYYRTENAIKGKASGTGLGLFIVHSIIKMHGGSIDVTSTYGQGSRFIIKLPQKKTKKAKIENILDQ